MLRKIQTQIGPLSKSDFVHIMFLKQMLLKIKFIPDSVLRNDQIGKV